MRLRDGFLRSISKSYYDYSALAFVVLLTLPALFPLLNAGLFDSHDGILHLYRLRALDDAIHNGIFYPRWFSDLAYGYGFPVLNYYSPLGYYVAEVFHLLGAGFIDALKLAFGAGFVLSGVAMYYFAREHLTEIPAILASAVYTYTPYHLADTYVRGALAESLAFVFMPAVLWSIHRAFLRQSSGYALITGVFLAALVLTHNLSFMLFGPILIAYIGLHLISTHNHKSIVLVTFSLLLAALLSAFYWLPAIGEMRYVLLGSESENFGYVKHLAPLTDLISPFLIFPYSPGQGSGHEYPLGLIYTFTVSFGIVGMLLASRRPQTKNVYLFGALLGSIFFIAAFLTLAPSNFIWELLRPLRYLQYPWRLQAITALVGAPIAGFAIAGIRTFLPQGFPGRALELTVVLLLTTMLGFTSMAEIPVKSLEITDSQTTTAHAMQFDFKTRQLGTTWSAEYLPLDVKVDRSVIGLPASNEVPYPSLNAEITTFRLIEITPLSASFSLTANAQTTVSLHSFYFPGWKGYVDGIPTNTYPADALGLVTVEIPAGTHNVTIRFEDTIYRTIGQIACLAGLFIVIFGLALARTWRVPLSVAGSILLLTLVLFNHTRTSARDFTPVQTACDFGDFALIGYSVGTPESGLEDSAEITLYWLSRKQTNENYSAFAHLISKDQQLLVSQHDGPPGYGFSPTSRWLPGEIVIDRHEMAIPPGTAPGTYRFRVGLYNPKTIKNLPVTEMETGITSEAVILGSLQINGK